MDAATFNTTLHCLRGHAPTPACLCKLQKLSLILEASQLEAFEYSSKEDRLIIYDNSMNVLSTVDGLIKKIDYDMHVQPEYRAKVKEFFLGNVSQPLEAQGTRLDNGQFSRSVLEGMLLPSEQDNSYVIFGTIKDITDFAKKEEQLTQKAQMDQLTGLYNHASGMHMISQLLADKSPFDSCALAMVDLDYFKQINDTYGHLFGDHVLKETASIFKEVLPSNTIAARFGGDEFVLFFPSINRIDLITLLNRMMQHIRNVEMLNDSDNLTCSIGICFLPENTGGYTYDQLLENADWALYQAKFNGRDTYSFCDDLNRYLEARNSDNPSFQQLNIRYLQNDPIATAFEILETSGSVEQGMELLLKIIGIRFHLDRINVIDIKLQEQTAHKAYAWMRDGVDSCFDDTFSFSKDEFRKIFQMRDETGLIKLDLEECMEGFSILNKLRATAQSKTALIAPMFWQGQMIGCITYAICRQKRFWSKNTKQQLSELSKIMAAHHGQSRRINACQNVVLSENKLDSLTGLITFSQFRERMEEKIVSGLAKNHAVIYTDFERFNLINQKYGYAFGDKLLQLFTKFVSDALSDKNNILFSRIVADQFILFRPYENIADAEMRVNAINNRFMDYVSKQYSFLKLRLRSGIYHVTGKCQNAAEAIDAANYARKSLILNHQSTAALYNEELAAKQQLEKLIFTNANNAFTDKEFKVFLQPKFSLEDNSLIGAEALIRWFREDGTQIYPDQFIPALEDNGRITELDFYVFERVVAFLAKNKRLGRKQVPISINASVLHTQNDNTVQRYLEILAMYGVSPALVEIELTETAAAQNFAKVYQLFDELRKSGIKTSLDDFGSGYSLVNMVVDIPIDTIKIDRKLLLNCENSIKGNIFLKNTIAMLHSLGYSTICEGVETETQRKLLLDCGCHKGQGYLFSRPIPMDEYERLCYGH